MRKGWEVDAEPFRGSHRIIGGLAWLRVILGEGCSAPTWRVLGGGGGRLIEGDALHEPAAQQAAESALRKILIDALKELDA